MANEVKWIKITTDVFDNWKIKQLKAMPELGHTLICIWFELLCMAGICNENGLIVLSNRFVATDEIIANTFGEDIKVVKMALETFVKLGMIEVTDNDAIQITNWLEYQSGDRLEEIKNNNKERQQRYRERQKTLQITDKKDRNVTRNVTNNVTPSYSYSFNIKNNNIENLIYILNNTNYENKDYINNNTKLLDVIKEWMTYKDAKKPKVSNHYDTQMGLQKCLTQFVKADKEYGTDEVARVVGLTISQNYQGVLWDKCRKDNNSNGDQRNVKGYDYRDYYGADAAKYDGNDMPFV